MILHRLTPGGPKNFNQTDVDYCCHPRVHLLDLAQEACLLNPDLILKTPSDEDWAEIALQLTLQALYEHQVYLINHITSLHAQLAKDNSELADLKLKIRDIKKANPGLDLSPEAINNATI